MSYYDYDPNYDFYYYDDYPDVDGNVFYEDDPFEYYPPEMKSIRRKHAILARPLEDTLSDDNLSSKYLVPVVYAPTRVSDPNKLLLNYNRFPENIDVYYSDRKNIEKEAKLFRQYAQPYYYASTIQEETESTASCMEPCCTRHEMVDVSRDRSVIPKSNKNERPAVEKWQENAVKTHKLKKKTKCTHNVNGAIRKPKKKIEIQKIDKNETSNSWTTLLSGSAVANKDTRTAIPRRHEDEIIPELPAKKSKSWVCVSNKSKASVKFDVKSDVSTKNVSERAQSELQAVRDTDRVPDDEDTMRNSMYQSTSNVQAMAVTLNNVPSGMVAWKNKAMKQDSSTTDTSKLSCGRDMKSNITIPDISDTTDITINSAEYREFLDTICKLKPENVPNQRFVSYDKSMPHENSNGNSNNITNKYQKVMVNATDSTETFLENMIRVKQAAEERQYMRRKVNPLLEVPLSISNKTLYIPFAMSDFAATRRQEGETRMVSKKKSIFVKVFRTIANVIACCQNYAYKYVLRFILFI